MQVTWLRKKNPNPITNKNQLVWLHKLYSLNPRSYTKLARLCSPSTPRPHFFSSKQPRGSKRKQNLGKIQKKDILKAAVCLPCVCGTHPLDVSVPLGRWPSCIPTKRRQLRVLSYQVNCKRGNSYKASLGISWATTEAVSNSNICGYQTQNINIVLDTKFSQ